MDRKLDYNPNPRETVVEQNAYTHLRYLAPLGMAIPFALAAPVLNQMYVEAVARTGLAQWDRRPDAAPLADLAPKVGGNTRTGVSDAVIFWSGQQSLLPQGGGDNNAQSL